MTAQRFAVLLAVAIGITATPMATGWDGVADVAIWASGAIIGFIIGRWGVS